MKSGVGNQLSNSFSLDGSKLPLLIQKHFFKYFPRIAVGIYFLSNIVLFAVLIKFWNQIDNVMYLDPVCNDIATPFVYNWGIVVSLLFILTGTLISTLRKIEDNYYFKRELQRIFLILVYLLVFFVFFETVYPLLNLHSTSTLGYTPFIFQELTALLLIYVCLFDIGMKARKDFDESENSSINESKVLLKSLLNPSDSTTASLKFEVTEILNDDSLFEILRKFMIQEFCVEELLFLSEVNNFKKHYALNAPEDIIKGAKLILDSFIASDSPLGINVSSDVRSDLKGLASRIKDLKEIKDESRGNDIIKVSSFDQAFNEVLQLVATDVFLRFKKSSEFQHMCHTIMGRSKQLMSLEMLELTQTAKPSSHQDNSIQTN
jgi:hypothetical protein